MQQEVQWAGRPGGGGSTSAQTAQHRDMAHVRVWAVCWHEAGECSLGTSVSAGSAGACRGALNMVWAQAPYESRRQAVCANA